MRRRWYAASELSIQGTLDPHRPLAEDMGVNHGGCQIGVPQQFLDGTNVLPRLEKMRREAVAEGVTTGGLQDARFVNRSLDRPLHDLLVLMMSGRSAGVRIPAQLRRRK